MQITQIRSQEKNKDRYSIYVDDSYSFSADKEAILQLKIHEGMELDHKALEELILEATYKKALDYALTMLSRSDKTESEIANRLEDRGNGELTIAKVMQRLHELGYVNDRNYVEKWVSLNAEGSSMNKKTIFRKLMTKGIEKGLIAEVLETMTVDEYFAARKLAEKKIKSLKGDKRIIKNKLFAHLYTKGFEAETCSRVVNELLSEDDYSMDE